MILSIVFVFSYKQLGEGVQLGLFLLLAFAVLLGQEYTGSTSLSNLLATLCILLGDFSIPLKWKRTLLV